MVAVVTLLVLGTALLLVEIVLPGLIVGTLGVLCILGGIVMGYMNFGFDTGNLILLGVVIASVFGMIAWFKYFPTSRIARAFISDRQIGTLGVERPELIGQTGTAFTDLRPSGTALLDNKRVDVVTEGSMISRGTPLKVIAVEGMRVIVRAL